MFYCFVIYIPTLLVVTNYEYNKASSSTKIRCARRTLFFLFFWEQKRKAWNWNNEWRQGLLGMVEERFGLLGL